MKFIYLVLNINVLNEMDVNILHVFAHSNVLNKEFIF